MVGHGRSSSHKQGPQKGLSFFMPSSNSLHGIDAEVAQRVANKLFKGISAQHIVNKLYLVVHLLA